MPNEEYKPKFNTEEVLRRLENYRLSIWGDKRNSLALIMTPHSGCCYLQVTTFMGKKWDVPSGVFPDVESFEKFLAKYDKVHGDT